MQISFRLDQNIGTKLEGLARDTKRKKLLCLRGYKKILKRYE